MTEDQLGHKLKRGTELIPKRAQLVLSSRAFNVRLSTFDFRLRNRLSPFDEQQAGIIKHVEGR
jgi:hypothetical protein